MRNAFALRANAHLNGDETIPKHPTFVARRAFATRHGSEEVTAQNWAPACGPEACHSGPDESWRLRGSSNFS